MGINFGTRPLYMYRSSRGHKPTTLVLDAASEDTARRRGRLERHCSPFPITRAPLSNSNSMLCRSHRCNRRARPGRLRKPTIRLGQRRIGTHRKRIFPSTCSGRYGHDASVAQCTSMNIWNHLDTAAYPRKVDPG